jgi:hypothetical protein
MHNEGSPFTTMTFPPLANIFAIHDPAPATLDAFERDLRASGEFAQIWRPADGWVCAVAPLPYGTPDNAALDGLIQQHSLAFAEGRDRVVDDQPRPEEAVRRVVEMADHHPDGLAALPGDFGFIRFRPDGEATVVRSCGGLAPMYVAARNGQWAIATRLGYFVRFLPEEPVLDPLPNAIWAASWIMLPDGRTFIKGVKLVERGYYAVLGRGVPLA